MSRNFESKWCPSRENEVPLHNVPLDSSYLDSFSRKMQVPKFGGHPIGQIEVGKTETAAMNFTRAPYVSRNIS